MPHEPHVRPSEPISKHRDHRLRIECGCGRIKDCLLREFAAGRRMDWTMSANELMARLRCRHCGERPRRVVVTRSARAAIDNHWGTGRTERALWPKR